jgi:DNA-binding GntR family transcriptional regulator
MPQSVITRFPLTGQVRGAVRERILDGRLAPGARVNESHLATELGVSRTPLREALAGLARDGFLVAEPGRGYSVSPLTTEEANELYPILGVLEATAVRMGGLPSGEHGNALDELNASLLAVGESPDDAIAANFAWHERLIGACPNHRLTALVRALWNQVRRYEYAFYAPGAARVRVSADLHAGILAALRANDIDRAARLVQDHWLTDLDRLLPRMQVGGS